MPLRLSLTGSPHVVRGKEGPAIALAPRDAVMLTWLITVGPTTRAQLAAMLWPERGDEQARNSLRQRLFQLRRQVGADLVVGTTTLELAADVGHDLDPESPLLGELGLPECPSLHAWLQGTRDKRARQHRATLIDKLDALEAQGDWHGALPLAESLVEMEPLSEHAHRRVMRLHYLRGDRAAALIAFDRLERRLKDDVGTRPDAASLALLHTIEQSQPLDTGPVRQARPVPASLLRPPRLVGRDAELARIRGIFDQGRTVALVGEAGIGKSRLLQALVHDRDDVMFWSGRAGDAITPYATLARGLRALLGSLPSEVTKRLPADVRADLARVMPELADPHMPLRSPRGGMPIQAVKHILRLAWPQGATFVLDDLHFADDASTELLQQSLDDEDRPLWRVIFTMRPTPRSPQTQAWVQQLIGAGLLVPVMLQPLDADDLARLVDSLELPGLDGGDLAAALHNRTGGNPLFALETLKLAWTESTSVDATRLPRPNNVTQLIEQQLVMRSEPALALARVAALAGVDFSLELAEAVLDKHAVDLSDAWRELESHQVMRGDGFAHDLVAESVRGGVPEAIGHALHARIAAWLEGHGGEPARVASHHEAAGRSDLAVPGLRAAAERAHLALREPERIDFLLHAADLAKAQDDRALEFECVCDAVEAHSSHVRDDTRLALLDRLDALASTTRERAVAAHIRAYYHGNLGHWPLAVEEGERALALAQAAGDTDVLVTARQRLGTAYAMTGQCDPALANLLSIREWMETHAQPPELREYFGNLAVVMDNAGRVDEARLLHERAIAEVEHTDDHPQRVSNLGNLAVNRLNAGDVSSAREHLAAAQQLAATHALAGTRGAFIALMQGRCARTIGRYAEALERFERARAGHGAKSVFEAVVRLHEAQCWLELGVHDRATHAIQEALDEQMPPRYRAPALVVRARIARALRQRGDAYIDEAVHIVPRGGWYELQFLVGIEAAQVAAPEAALEELAAIVKRSQAMGFHGMALAARLRACDIAATADPARAARLARQALLSGTHVEAESLPRVERWLQPARALDAAGEHEDAADVARLGAAWLQEAARLVPERWRDNFLSRAELNQQMLALAAKLG
jgi:DNA-binding SARP family transcriptional activator/tetratricopeptide (TPR) repeat protein